MSRRKIIFGSLLILTFAAVASSKDATAQSSKAGAAEPPEPAVAEPLTRSKCWTSKLDTGATRTFCFVKSGRVNMKNRNQTTDGKSWSSCEWSGLYLQNDDTVTIAFAPGSGKCSNGAKAPQWAANCKFADQELSCEGSSIVDGKLYHLNLTFN